MRLSDAEVRRLREYLLKGGFLYVDDFWGDGRGISGWKRSARVVDPKKYPIVDLKPSHPLFRTMFVIQKLPQIPSINHWMRSGGRHVGARRRKRRFLTFAASPTSTAGSWS